MPRFPIITGLLLLLTACAGQPVTEQEDADRELSAANDQMTDMDGYWWYARYRINWPPQTDPDWPVDLLVADTLVKPVLHTHRDSIRYWRFHRRALRDGTGHQFSFIFYADKTVAVKIYGALQNDPLAQELLDQGILTHIITNDINNNVRTEIGDTSDEGWPEMLQTAWPAYIMGVSRLWLQLIEQSVSVNPENDSVAAMLAEYRRAHAGITSIWQTQGEHALLHHLNAIFGYEPLLQRY